MNILCNKENQAPVIDMPNGKHTTTGEGNRIYQAAFTNNEKRGDQIITFPGFICQGTFSQEEADVLKDYGWEMGIQLKDGMTMWQNQSKDSVRYTAEALDLRVFFPKTSLIFWIN
jgi:hypothetical protein